MIHLFRTQDCPRCARIQDALEAMAVAHQVTVCDPDADRELPRLEDDGETVVGADAILQHLDKLEAFKEQWYKFQSDACYCSDDGGIE